MGTGPTGIAIAPNGSKAYVANTGSNSVTPITPSTDTAGTAISVGTDPTSIAFTPDSAKAYVSNYNSSSVTPITVFDRNGGDGHRRAGHADRHRHHPGRLDGLRRQLHNKRGDGHHTGPRDDVDADPRAARADQHRPHIARDHRLRGGTGSRAV